jgi:hypothetical protein
VTHDVVRLVYRDLPTPDVLVMQRCTWTIVADPRVNSQDVETVVGRVRADATRHDGLDEQTTIPDPHRHVSFGDITLPVLRRIVFPDALG